MKDGTPNVNFRILHLYNNSSKERYFSLTFSFNKIQWDNLLGISITVGITVPIFKYNTIIYINAITSVRVL